MNWYVGIRLNINTWSDFVTRFKAKFLSDNHEYYLMDEIQNRKQGENESVTTFISDMVGRFRMLSQPIPEARQCHIIHKNLKRSLALFYAGETFTSLSILEQKCRNREEMLKNFEPKDSKDRTRKARVNVCDVEEPEQNVEDTPFDGNSDEEERTVDDLDLAVAKLLIRRLSGKRLTLRDKKILAKQNETDKAKQSDKGNKNDKKRECMCWNCRKPGHVSNDCPEDPRVFCYKCGEQEVYAPKCPKCQPKNSKGGFLSGEPEKQE